LEDRCHNDDYDNDKKKRVFREIKLDSCGVWHTIVREEKKHALKVFFFSYPRNHNMRLNEAFPRSWGLCELHCSTCPNLSEDFDQEVESIHALYMLMEI
jgi:hypothetical protein